MLTPNVVAVGYFTPAAQTITASAVYSITIPIAKSTEQLAAVPAFTGYDPLEINPVLASGLTSYDDGRYPTTLPDSGVVAGTKRDFEEVMVIVQPANQKACVAMVDAGIFGQATYTSGDASGVTPSTAAVNFYGKVVAAPSALTLDGTELFQYVVMKVTALPNAS